MKVVDIYNNAREPVFSLEVSPSINGFSLAPIFNTIGALKKYDPKYVSVTCSALGSARGGTIPIAAKIMRDFAVETVVHLTCVAKSEQDIENMLMDVKYEGIQNILALRGDAPRGEKVFTPHEKGHRYASDFVKQIKRMNKGLYLTARPGEYRDGEPTDFCACVAGYPEGHPQCPDKKLDFQHLKVKVDSGADYIITQLFFEPRYFIDFAAKIKAAGINIPVIPGVMPIESYAQLDFILQQPIGVEVPPALVERFKKFKDAGDGQGAQEYGVQNTVGMINALLESGAPGIHLYTMNSPDRAGRVLAKYFGY